MLIPRTDRATRGAVWLAVAGPIVASACMHGSRRAAFLRNAPTYDAATFFATLSVRGSSISADGTRVLVSTNASGVFNVYGYPVDGREPTQLTRSTDDALFAIDWFRHDDRFLFAADRGGDELDHIYVQHDDGAAIDLTPGSGFKAQFAGWHESGRWFHVRTNERDPQVFDLYRYEVPARAAGAAAYPRNLVYENRGRRTLGPLSRNGRWLALIDRHDNRDSDVYLVDLRSPEAEPWHVTPHQGAASFQPVTFDPGSATLYYTSDLDSEFQRLWRYEISSGTAHIDTASDWDVQGVSFTRDTRYRVLSVNADARTVLRVVDARDGRPVAMPRVAGGRAVVGFDTSWDGATWILRVAGDTSPGDLWVCEAGARSARPLTDSLPDAIDPRALVAGQVVRYPSFDGLEIPAILYRPHRASSRDPVPALVWVHGGPGGQSRVGYSPVLQFLVNRGYAILMVNNRGSSGYGKTFFHMDDRRHGDVDLKDCVSARAWLESLNWVDGERVAIMGGSYGGYMVAAALAFEPDAFDAGIDIFGVTNWERTLNSIPPWWGANRDALYAELGDPKTDGERLRAISPLFHADKINKPLLVVQGANDPRVLQVESDELVAAARSNGVPVEYIVFADEGHGFENRENEIVAARAYARFLDQHLAAPRRRAAPRVRLQ